MVAGTIRVAFFAILVLLGRPLVADLVLNTVNVAETIDFTGFDGSGFDSFGVNGAVVSGGMLNSDTFSFDGFDTNVAFGGTGTADDPARGSDPDGVSTGGVYNFDTGGGNASLGVQPGGTDFTPGSFYLRVRNGTTSTMSDFAISYDAYVYNDQGRANSFNFEYAASASDTLPGSFTSVSALDLTSGEAADVSPTWALNSRSTTLTGLSVGAGEYLFLRWIGNDVSGSGSRDQFALDNISVNGMTAAAVPEPRSAALLGIGLITVFLIRLRRDSSVTCGV